MRRNVLKKILGLGLLTTTVAATGVLSSCQGSSKTVITSETGGLPAPFIETLDSADGAIYTTKEGVYLAGYDIALITEVFKTDYFKDYELDLSVTAFASALTDAQQGVVDFTINNWSYNDSRADSYYFSYPYTKTKYEIISKFENLLRQNKKMNPELIKQIFPEDKELYEKVKELEEKYKVNNEDYAYVDKE